MKKFQLMTLFTMIILISSNIVFSKEIIEDELKYNSNQSILSKKPSEISSLLNYTEMRIEYPLSTIPIIVENEGFFHIKIEVDDFNEIYVYISTAYESIVEDFWLFVNEFWLFEDYWYINVSVPSIVPEELYNVTVMINQGGKLYSTSQPRAVSVVKEFNDDFSFIHITDFHIGDPRGFSESIWKTIGGKSVKRCISEINLLKPDFVIISGDLVFGQLYPFEYHREYQECYEMIQMFDVPTYLCPGNHDGYRRPGEDGLEIWKKYFGPLYYSFNYGNYHFQSINSFDIPASRRISFFFFTLNWGGSIQNEQLQWIQNDISENAGKLNFMFMHHNPLWETTKDSFVGRKYKNREELLSIINHHKIDMVLAGHVHYDNVTVENSTLFITTTTPVSSVSADDSYWGYRLITIQEGKINSYNYKEPKYSIPTYQIKIKYTNNRKISVENNLEMDIMAHLRFTLPLADYQVDNGEIVLQRWNDRKIELYVEVIIEQNTTKTIKVTETDSVT